MTKLGLASMLSLTMLSFAPLAACDDGGDDGGDSSDSTDGDGTPMADAAPGGSDAAPGDWEVLMQGDWSVPAGVDAYYCVVITIEADTYIKAFKPMIPQGTHHTVLTQYQGNLADGTHECSVGTNGNRMVYGSGVGSPEFHFPDGIGLRLPAGTRLLLNLHLFNAGEQTLTGTSGTYFQRATAAEIEHEAEIVLAGPTFTLSVPQGVSTQSGNCNVSTITNEPIKVFALSQHMHMAGRHLKSEVIRGDQTFVLQDVDYDFEAQGFSFMTPEFELKPGDVLKTSCTFDYNEQHPAWPAANLPFGDSSTDEMCFTDIFYYPAQGANFTCTGL